MKTTILVPAIVAVLVQEKSQEVFNLYQLMLEAMPATGMITSVTALVAAPIAVVLSGLYLSIRSS